MNDLDLNDILKYLFSKATLICSLIFSVAVFTSIIALNLNEVYRSEALLQVSESSLSSSTSGSSSSSYQGLASLAGVDLGGGDSSSKSPSYVVAKITSRSFFKHLISFPGVLEGIVAYESFDLESKKISYNKELFNEETGLWIREPSGLKKAEPFLEAHLIFLQNLSISIDKKTQFITLVYEHASPFFAKEMLDLVVREVNNLQRDQDLVQSTKEMTYLTDMQSSNRLLYLEQSISMLIMKLLKDQMLANVSDEYMIEYIDEPLMPESRIWPKRTQLVLTVTFLSSFLIIFFMLFYRFIFMQQAKN